MTPQPTELDGICELRHLLNFSVLWKPEMNLFKFSLHAVAVAGCEEDDGGIKFKVRCNNEPSDFYATYSSYIKTTCSLCDTSCPPKHLVAVENRSRTSTDGFPPEFQGLRDKMNQTCNDYGEFDIPESARKKLGPDTISGGVLHEAILAELHSIFPDLGDGINMSCADVANSGVCQCGSNPGPLYGGISPRQKD